jgi:type VI secretion system protein ImpL
MKKLFGWLFHPLLLAILGLLAASLIVWFVGPLIAIDRYRPLESETVRWILIGVMVFVWVAKKIWGFVKGRLRNARLMDGLAKSAPPPPQAPTAGQAEVAALDQRFQDAIAVLKQVRLAAAGKRPDLGDLLALSGRQYLYQLPWYLFIGAPGSGKTTALINSGLSFPLAEKFGTASIRGVGGTRNCDWWFTDEAVLLDTAGRYTTQESDREADAGAWQGFLQLLKKSRPRRPINGVMLTLSVADLLQQSPTEREAHASAVRTRLQELHEQFQTRFPIYLLVTKADLLAGFNEFFATLGKEERAQVWGMTFAHRDDAKQAPTAPLAAEFATEFDALQTRLIDRVLERMHAERDPAQRALIHAFPQQFGNLKLLLGEFLERVFAASKFEQAPLLRGVYFTSGTQEGNPIDRVMGALARSLGLERRLVPPAAASGRSYFITTLLRQVIFAEQGLAGTNLRWERRRTLLQWGAYALAALLLVGAAGAWFVSYTRNRAYVAEVEARLPVIKQQVEALPSAAGSTDVVGLLPLLNSVRDLAALPDRAGRGLHAGLPPPASGRPAAAAGEPGRGATARRQRQQPRVRLRGTEGVPDAA